MQFLTQQQRIGQINLGRDYMLASPLVPTPPVPSEQLVGYAAPQAFSSLAIPANALVAPTTQTLAGTPANISLGGLTVSMPMLLILAALVYFFFLRK